MNIFFAVITANIKVEEIMKKCSALKREYSNFE
jgi:hypothetical protein